MSGEAAIISPTNAPRHGRDDPRRITLRNVRKAYHTRHGDNLVLDDVGFELRMGEKLGVLGRNGAGKSTMVRLISGAEKPNSGLIERTMSVSWPLAFGGAFQYMLTGVDNVRFISRIYNQDFARNLAFVEDFAELGPYLHEPVRTYSSGMRARLAFAISMIIEFDCFLIDEIGAVGDARFHARCNYELFEKRGDRSMVIISHDAAYVRNHCTRFAILHDAKLTLYDDFEYAYREYNVLMGLVQRTTVSEVRFTSRAAALEALQAAAFGDERFRLLVQQGDWARDRHDWAEAEEKYAAALALHPYERSYWAQHGHVTRAQGKNVEAEISYRTACALGVPAQDLKPFLDSLRGEAPPPGAPDDVFGLSQGKTCLQPPSRRDVDVIARLFWGEGEVDPAETLALMRAHRTLDDLASAIASDARTLEHSDLSDGPPAQGSENEDSIAERNRWILDLCHLALPNFDYLDAETRTQTFRDADPLNVLMMSEAFSSWEKTLESIKRLKIS